MKEKPILIKEYDYELPDEKIAKYPLARRDQSKLLIYRRGEISEKKFYEISGELEENSLLLYNNTRVIQARMIFQKNTGARIEIFCLEPLLPSDYVLSFASNETCTWKCMVGNLKKWKNGSLEKEIQIGNDKLTLQASLEGREGNTFHIRFQWDNKTLSFADILDSVGELPIPPYLNRDTEEQDKETYQTVYSRIEGSVAAPTAGLHFTPEVLQTLTDKHIKTQELTLHVGAGTFQPVKADDISEHCMHTEIISVKLETIKSLLAHEGPVIAVGTTTVRTLESLYFIGKNLLNNKPGYTVEQWQPYEEGEMPETSECLRAIVEDLVQKGQHALHAQTRIMIRPGYSFKIIDGLITNFHQPRSTLLLLVSALIGEDWKKVYNYASGHDFRFLSYGDSSLLLPK